MATSPEKLRQLLEMAGTDAGPFGKFLRIAMVIPGSPAKDAVRDLLAMPPDELDQMLGNVLGFVGQLISDPQDALGIENAGELPPGSTPTDDQENEPT